jgi:hypothetical protein
MVPHLIQTAFHRTVVNGVSNANDRSAKKITLQRIFWLNLFAGKALQSLHEPGLLLIVQRSRGKYVRPREPLALLNDLLKRRDYFRDGLSPAVIDDDKKKIAKNFGSAESRDKFFDYAMLGFARNRRVAEKIAQLRGFLICSADVRELLENGFGRALLQGDIRKRVGVLVAGGFQFSLPCSV